MELGTCLAGDTIYGIAVAGVLRGAYVAPGDPSGGGEDERRVGRWMLALAQVVDITSIFLAPVLAGRRPSQYGVVVAAVTLTGAGALVLLVVADTATALWVVLLGLGQGACFSLALTFFALRAPDSEHAAAHSGMAQPVGYLLAAVGPLLFGVLRIATQAWTVPLVLLFAVAVCLLITGLGAARDAYVGSA